MPVGHSAAARTRESAATFVVAGALIVICAGCWLWPVSIHLRLLCFIVAGAVLAFLLCIRLASRRPHLRRPFFILCTTAPVLLLGTEALLAWLDWREAAMSAPLRKSVDGERQGMLVRSPVTGYQLAPRQYYELWGGTLTIDRNGFRSTQDVSPEKRPGCRRIMLLGGSTVFGWGVPDGQELGGCLQAALDAQVGADQYEVVNAGVPYFASFQELNWYLHVVWAFKPDILVVLHGHNDVIYAARAGSEWRTIREGDVGEIPFLSPATVPRPTSFLEAALTRSALYRRLYAPFANAAPEPAPGPDLPVEQVGTVDPGCIDQFMRHADILDREARQAGTVCLFALQPVIYTRGTPTAEELQYLSTTTHYREQVRLVWSDLRVAATRGSAVHVDLSDVFEKVAERVYIDACHYSAVGNRLIAERLMREILQRDTR